VNGKFTECLFKRGRKKKKKKKGKRKSVKEIP